jgi:hypothetical protein
MQSYLIVTDTPGIKSFIFGTDPLPEVRGASALLDRLNRKTTESILRRSLRRGGGKLERTVYANGGAGQFVVAAKDTDMLRDALAALDRHYRDKTGGEARIAFGFAELGGDRKYPEAVREANAQLRARRDRESGHRAATLLPMMQECQTSSHLPAEGVYTRAPERPLLSVASRRKRDELRRGHRHTRWIEWMEELHRPDNWPDRRDWEDLRSQEIDAYGEAARRKGYIGLVYADGNRMGRLVQELDSVETCHTFSKIVDDSIKEACFHGLNRACAGEIRRNREAHRAGDNPTPLPADILMLGGDDLIVLLPADRALPFVQDVTGQFEERTRRKIAAIEDPQVRGFFTDGLGDRGMTISCGVALARAKFPFYLLLDLAEKLLKSAKDGGAEAAEEVGDGDPSRRFWSPSYVDFHLVTGPSSFVLKRLRETDYRVKTRSARTLRPVTVETLGRLRAHVGCLRRAGLPRGKVHDLFEAALDPHPNAAERRVRELFGRCKGDAREALWKAARTLVPVGAQEFPWCAAGEDRRTTAIADLAECYDLFPEDDTP